MHLADQFPGLGKAQGLIADALIAGLTVAPDVLVSEWAERTREVSAESGSPKPGKWRNAETPYGVEPMNCLSLNHPASDVTLMCAAQMIKSEVGVNWIGSVIDVTPAIDEAIKFNRIKLQPTIEATAALQRKVKEVKSRDEKGSTSSFKRFRGGYVQLTHAGSSKGLQGITVMRAIMACGVSSSALIAANRLFRFM